MAAGILIVNPFATGVDGPSVAAVEAALPHPLETRRTTHAGEATEIARAATDVDAIYVFGGDGTYNEVLNGAASDVPLGFVPGGGTSVLPRALGLPRDPVQAAEQLARGRERRIGLGRVDGRRFGFNAGIGFDAELVRRIDRLGRSDDGRRPGDIAFVRATIGYVAESRATFEPALEIEGLGRAAFALVANCSPYTYAGPLGLDLVPGAGFDEGLAVIAPVRVRPLDLPRIALHAARGGGLERRPDVLYRRDADRLVVRCDRPLPLQVDGEDVGDVTEATFESEPDAVVVLV